MNRSSPLKLCTHLRALITYSTAKLANFSTQAKKSADYFCVTGKKSKWGIATGFFVRLFLLLIYIGGTHEQEGTVAMAFMRQTPQNGNVRDKA